MPAPPSLPRIARAAERWFARHQRPLPWRATYDSYHVWVSEVMAQQTRMEVVVGYFDRFLARFPDLAKLAAADEQDVVAAWSGLGYYRRARMLHQGARDVVARFGGAIPRNVDELLTIPGIGRYTAGAIASIAHQQRAPIVDGNVARVLSRVFAGDDCWSYAEALVAKCDSPRALNQSLMELGAMVCRTRNPLCPTCPLQKDCLARATGRIDDFPPRKARPETRELHIPLFVVTDRRGHLLMRRGTGRLMADLFHLPHGDRSLLDAPPLAVTPIDLLGRFRHTVTTRRITFELFTATVARKPEGYTWIDPTQMDQVPHPSYVKKALAIAGRRSPIAPPPRPTT